MRGRQTTNPQLNYIVCTHERTWCYVHTRTRAAHICLYSKCDIIARICCAIMQIELLRANGVYFSTYTTASFYAKHFVVSPLCKKRQKAHPDQAHYARVLERRRCDLCDALASAELHAFNYTVIRTKTPHHTRTVECCAIPHTSTPFNNLRRATDKTPRKIN